MTNKIAIITGGRRGLGRTTAVNPARRGVDNRANREEPCLTGSIHWLNLEPRPSMLPYWGERGCRILT
jgi:hypothetical protein